MAIARLERRYRRPLKGVIKIGARSAFDKGCRGTAEQDYGAEVGSTENREAGVRPIGGYRVRALFEYAEAVCINTFRIIHAQQRRERLFQDIGHLSEG